MPRNLASLRLLILCCLLGNNLTMAQSNGPSGSLSTPGSAASQLQTQQSQASLAGDASDNKKPFTISATIREIYDDNIFTTKSNLVSSFNTEISPSILLDFPMEDSEFTARYTFGATYYENRTGDSFDLTHEASAQYNHSFSDRFSMTAAEDFRYFTEPSIFESIGTPYRSGAYYANTVNLGFNAQWTPLFGTSTTYANNIIKYETSSIATGQDNIENTVGQNFLFAILPKVNLVFGAIYDDTSYDSVARGYTSYTGTTGLDWQALPTLSIGGRVGASYITAEQAGSSASPYGAVTVNWQLGARSSLKFDYTHSVVPTDLVSAEAQIGDRFDTTFTYNITPKINVHLDGIFTYGQYTTELSSPGSASNFSEDDYGIDTGAVYHLNNLIDLSAGYLLSGVSSQLSFRDYTRNQVYIGIRGTY